MIRDLLIELAALLHEALVGLVAIASFATLFFVIALMLGGFR
jgi:hypothetical protein